MNKKKIAFLTGTRADFGKLKSLMKITQNSNNFEVHIFVTGMHMNSKYGKTVDEVVKSGFKNIYMYINHDDIDHMDRTLAKTIDGFSHYISEIQPNLIVVHGDRVEALAGAIVGSLNNILVAHIEGGEISGTIDELIRHSVSKMSHIHLVSNDNAKKRIVQLGENSNSIHVIGSPDLDLMSPKNLPNLMFVKNYYDINFQEYAILMFHPITTEYENIKEYIKTLVDVAIDSNLNYVVIYPNNDLGSSEILHEYKRLENNKKFKIFPSLRFEYFLQLLQNTKFIMGNSSAGIMEAPYYKVPTVDIGTRQKNRVVLDSIFHSNYKNSSIVKQIKKALEYKKSNKTLDIHHFGNGRSDEKFLQLLNSDKLWTVEQQKEFCEITQ